MKILPLKAKEKGTYVVTLNYYDEDGDALTPTTMTWTLSNPAGETINSRADVSIAVPSTQNNVVLSGLDLAITESASEVMRVFTIKGTYTSSYGVGLPLNDEVGFYITNLKAVS